MKRQVLISKIEKPDNVISPYLICKIMAKMPNINTVPKAETIFSVVTSSMGLKNVIAWAQHFHEVLLTCLVLDLNEANGSIFLSIRLEDWELIS